MIDETSLAEHELGTFVRELKKHANLLAEVPEEEVSWFPAKYEETKNELQAKTPQHWTPSYLTTTHVRMIQCLPNSWYLIRT